MHAQVSPAAAGPPAPRAEWTDSRGSAAGEQTCALARRPWASVWLWLRRLNPL